MSAHNIELAAKVSAYASNFELVRAWPALQVLTHVVDGGVETEPAAAYYLDVAGQAAGVPAYSDWRTTPAAETAIAERVRLQQEYETSYAHWLPAINGGQVEPYYAPGRRFASFKLPEQDEVMKLTVSSLMTERVEQVHYKSDALVVVDGLHAALEQIRAMSFWDGGLVVDLAKGTKPERATAETVRQLTTQNVDDAFDAIKLASDRRIWLDDAGENVHVVAPEGFTFFDFFRLGGGADTRGLFESNCRVLWRRGICLLGDERVQMDTEARRQRVKIIAHTLQRLMDLGVTPHDT